MRRVLLTIAAPLAAIGLAGPVVDRLARSLAAAPRTGPGEPALRPAVEALGGEVVRLRSRDGVRLMARWLTAEHTHEDSWQSDPREAILLLHGWTGSIVPDLVELGPFLRRTAGVLGLDFRGHGGSDDGPSTFGYLEIEDVAGALAWFGERGIRRVASSARRWAVSRRWARSRCLATDGLPPPTLTRMRPRPRWALRGRGSWRSSPTRSHPRSPCRSR